MRKATLKQFLEDRGFHKIPLSVNKAGHFEMRLKLNGKRARFILDTGASHTVVDSSAAEKFKVIAGTRKGKKAGGLGTTGLETKVSKDNTIEISKVKLNGQKLVLLDLTHVNLSLENNGSENVTGIVGADILKKKSAVIDYKGRALFLKQ